MTVSENCINIEGGQRVAGIKQVTRGIINNEIRVVYLSTDCDGYMGEKILGLCGGKGITVKKIYTAKELGKACGIKVGSAVVGIKCPGL